MKRIAHWMAGALILTAATGTLATIEEDVADGQQMDTILLNAINEQGMKPGEAVVRILQLRPDRADANDWAYQTVTAAICLVPNYKKPRCTAGGEYLRYEGCGDTVEDAALDAGAPPGTVARAVAAGRMCWDNRVPPPASSGRGGNGCRGGFASCS